MRVSTSLIFFLTFNRCFAQSRLDTMIPQLRQSEFGYVEDARDSFLLSEKNAIPILIELLKDTSFVKLQNTADLIYPGAEKFYGHGRIVNYDIDWGLEEITFQNFGYQEHTISEDKLMKLHQDNYTDYLQTGSYNVDFKNKTPRQKLVKYRQILADSVSQLVG
jgi:hypothetical protein